MRDRKKIYRSLHKVILLNARVLNTTKNEKNAYIISYLIFTLINTKYLNQIQSHNSVF